MTNDEIRAHLFELADEKYQAFHQNLCPGVAQIIGVRIPKMREFAKELAKDSWQQYLENPREDYNEEIMLQGLVIGYVDTDIETRLTYLAKFVPKINSWAVCDSPCMGMKFIKKNRERMLEFIQPYLNSEREYEVRFGIVTLLDYYVDKEHIDYVLEVLEHVKHEGYYVKMAAAWTLCECYLKCPKETNAFLENTQMDIWTYNKGIQKMTESRRVTAEDKIRLKAMKK
ncbi:MAG: DNA alkylation repair protein [Hespellia sp.]|nr:DNA alkylation repair protein [Hespellia sp.]